MSNTLCFTGHRPNKISNNYSENSLQSNQLKLKIENALTECIFQGYDTFLTGMAMGSDIICSEVLIELKSMYPHLKLIACIPHKGQEISFPPDWKKRYHNVLSHCDEKVYIATSYDVTNYKKRNLYMVDNSSLVVAVYNGNYRSGTYQTINLAKQKGKQLVIISPIV